MSSTLRERQISEAVSRMNLMGLREDAIRKFEQNGTVHLSAEDGTLGELTKDDLRMIEQFEREHNAVVFLVVRTLFGIAVLDSLLYVSRYDEEWEDEIESLKDGYVLTYTVNYLNPECSEFGDIAFSTTPDGEIIREG